jgi:hypothetical protein
MRLQDMINAAAIFLAAVILALALRYDASAFNIGQVSRVTVLDRWTGCIRIWTSAVQGVPAGFGRRFCP